MKPTDDTIALVGFLLGGDWLCADEIRHGIAKLGFEMPSPQWVSGRLSALSRESAPRFARRPTLFSDSVHEYRVTTWAVTGLSNNWRGFDTPARDLPTPFPKATPTQHEETP